MSLHPVYAFIFAGIAAVGNAIFAYGQKRAEVADNPFVYIIPALLISVLLFTASAPFFGRPQFAAYFAKNGFSIALAGAGFYLTFIGFYYLYTRFGTSYYSLYAVLSILTTSIVVGVWIFKEQFNLYYGLSTLCAILTVILFALGQRS